MIRIILPVLVALGVSGCAANNVEKLSALPITQGPAAELLDRQSEPPLACLRAQIALEYANEMKKGPGQRRSPKSFGVLDVLDKSGAENRVGNDSFGTFMSQGVSDMLYSTLSTVGVPTVELSLSYRIVVDWLSSKETPSLQPLQVASRTDKDEKLLESTSIKQARQKTAKVRTPDIGLIGAITSFDAIPGGGIAAGVGGVSGNYSKNAVLAVIDLRAVDMGRGGHASGTVIAHATVVKQIVQDGFNVTLDRYVNFGPGSPRLVNLEAGYMKREPTKYSNREMTEVVMAEVLSQVYRYHRCTENKNFVTALN